MLRDTMLELIEANMAGHLAHLPSHLDTALILDEADLLPVDSGMPSDTFNAVCRARLDRENAGQRIDAAIEHFRTRRLPFSWWVSSVSTPANLRQRLVEHGLEFADTEVAMSLDLTRLSMPVSAPSGLEIRTVADDKDLAEYATVIAGNWDPPDWAVTEVYSQAASGTLRTTSPARYHTAYLDSVPVAVSECYLSHGVAGIFNVVTLPWARRRGFGTAVTAAALGAARREGYRTAVLQASAPGQRIYARLGFTACDEFQEYKPPGASK